MTLYFPWLSVGVATTKYHHSVPASINFRQSQESPSSSSLASYLCLVSTGSLETASFKGACRCWREHKEVSDNKSEAGA